MSPKENLIKKVGKDKANKWVTLIKEMLKQK